VYTLSKRAPSSRVRLLHRIYELDIALRTGMRKGEQYSVRWPDVNLDRGELIARDTKNGTDRVVILTPSAVKSLTALKALPLHRKRRAKDRPNNSAGDSVFSVVTTRSGSEVRCVRRTSSVSAGMTLGTRSAQGWRNRARV
jgi:integrase